VALVSMIDQLFPDIRRTQQVIVNRPSANASLLL
jgi:hypothetical protein